MMPAKWCLERAIEQLECADEHGKWAAYHRLFKNKYQEEREQGIADRSLLAAKLLIEDALKTIEGDDDGRKES